MKSLFTAVLLFGVFASGSPNPSGQVLQVDPAKGKVKFLAVGKPSMIKIRGKGEGPSGSLVFKDGKIDGELCFNLESLKTGISLRDSHMKEKYIDVAKNPKACLTMTKFEVPPSLVSGNGEVEDVPFEGLLKLKGQTKKVTGFAEIEREGREIECESKFNIVLSDFGFEIPSYLGVTVAKTIKVETKFVAQAQ